MTVLTRIQQEIEEVYNLPPQAAVEEFLINETTVRRLIDGHDIPLRGEMLLVVETPDGPRLGLYIAADILNALETDSPWQRLSLHNLERFCTAIEGVSHFLFLAGRISEGRPVSHLELEVQAEIDKFLLCLLTLERHHSGHVRRTLGEILFENYRLLRRLNTPERERYHFANRLARRFCRRLEKISHPLWRPQFIAEARAFRKRGLQGKIHQLTNQPSRANLAA